MTITREQVADLQPGDVVELAGGNLRGAIVRGPVFQDRNGWLLIGPEQVVRDPDGDPSSDQRHTLTVVSRAPRPLYVNHPRTEVRKHDVIRDGEGVIRHCDAGGFGGEPTWWSWNYQPGWKWTHTTMPPQPLTLLVDGETGQVVP